MKCKHNRDGYCYLCKAAADASDNAGSLSISSDGGLAFGIGGGLTIDSSGDLGIQVAPGFSIEL